jgi:DNA-binding beta-propeller fold protein YncE
VQSVTGPKRPWFAAGALLALAGAAGCGNQYRPVINPIQPTGPASQPSAFVVAFSQPGLTPAVGTTTNPCPATPYAQPGIVTLVDFSGEGVMAQASLGTGPLTFALDASGSTAYSTNCDGTLSAVPLSSTLQSNKVLTTSLPTGTDSNGATVNTLPTNLLVTSAGEYVVEQNNQKAVGALTNNTSGVASLKLEIPVAASLVNLVGVPSGQRIYAISQGNSTTGAGVTWGQCSAPTSVATPGEADGIEVSSNSVSSQLAVGKCPVYGLMTADSRRTFILNRGSGTVTVIDSVKNQLDTSTTTYLTGNATIPVGTGSSSGPVYADIYAPASLLVTANYDDDTISIIDVSINGAVQGFTDTANFGHVLATVKVGHHPAAVTVLQDGSRVYVANEGDLTDGGNGSVTIVNLSSFTVEGTLQVNGHPRSIASTFNAPIGKVYTIAQDSPYLTVIRTDTNIVSASILLQGNGVDLHTTTQYAGNSGTTVNAITQSRSSGSGAP